MGSILSFPILCLANLGVYLKVTRAIHVGWSSEERLRHVLVNGDDMVYSAPKYLWEEHVGIGQSVGLKMSVGKAYHHKTYLNVNSTSIHCCLDSSNDHHALGQLTPYQIDYLNSGLYIGQHKVQGGSEDSTRISISPNTDGNLEGGEVIWKDSVAKYACAHLGQDPRKGFVENLNTLLQGSRPGKQVPLLKMYLHRNRESIAYECLARRFDGEDPTFFSRNLFIPKSLGGMGCVAPTGWKTRVTATDRYRAAWIMSKFACRRTTQLPLPGVEATSIDGMCAVPWIQEQVERDVPVIRYRTAYDGVRVNLRFLKIRQVICGFIPYWGRTACAA